MVAAPFVMMPAMAAASMECEHECGWGSLMVGEEGEGGGEGWDKGRGLG